MLSEARVLAYDSLVDLRQRHEVTAPAGTSVAEMVALAFPGLRDGLRSMLRVTIGEHVVPEHLWARVRPKPGTTVLVRPVPGNDVLRNVLTIAITVAAIAAGQFYAPALLSTIGVAATTTSTAIASAAITATTLLAGTLLLNALVPTQRDAKDRPTYAIQGIKNQLTPDGVVPAILGRIRQAPVYACIPYTEVVGDDHYIVAAFLHGYGPLDITTPRIGDTPVERFFGVQYETRPGRPDDPPLSIVTRTVIETQLQIELKGTGPYGGPQSRFTAADVTECSVDITFPGGLVAFAKDGTKKIATVNIRIEYRLESDTTWFTAAAVPIAAKVQKSISRSFPITFPTRGRYEIRITRATRDWDDEDQSKRDTQYTARSFWTVMRSIRPEYPLAFDQPMALSAVRILASGQLNGTLDEWNSIDGSLLPDWDAPSGQWVERVTPNPASHFRAVLTGAAISYPLALDEIDLTALQDWHEFCADKGLTYNRVHNYEASVIDVLSGIAAAGRASPHDTGTKWGVVIDRALSQITQHISPRNSWGFQGERPYSRFPDAFRVSFLDETNNWAQAERVVPWPGHVGDIDVTEKIEMPGVTNPDMIWRETRRRQYELIHRPDTYTVSQDWEGLAAGRGDRVQLSHDVLDRIMVAARVVSVSGANVFLDETVTMVVGQSYAVRFRRADGTSLLRTVRTIPGEHSFLMLTGVGETPSGPSDASASGDLAFFGLASRESFACTVKGVEAMDNFTSRLTLIDHAPEIEALVDAEVPPPWNGRVGDDIGQAAVPPSTPTITSIVSGRLASTSATEANPYPVVVSLQPGDTVPLASYEAQHRLIGASVWSLTAADAASGIVSLPGYAKGDQVEVQARSRSTAGVAGAWTATLTHVVAATDPAAPSAPQALTASQVSGASSPTIRATVTSSADPNSAATRLYIAAGASAPFSAASAYMGDQASGPNTTLPPRDLTSLPNGTALAAGPYRLWATALDGNSPPVESIPFGPVSITLS